MKLLVVLACVALAAATEQELWEKFKAEHGKVYKSPIQERVRFIIFKEALKTIEAHNAKFESGESSYKMGINQFADLTPAEFKAMLNYKKVDLPITGLFVPPKNFTAPTSIDWRNKGAVLGVKDQGQCGSCWAFSTTGSLEGQNAIHHSKKISLSEQELVDCSSSYGNEGCDGGDMAAAFQYIHAKGIGTEAGYKYTGKDGTCKHPTRADVKVTGFTRVGASESALHTAVGSVGPISVAMNAELIQYYDSGIFDDSSCSKDLDHGVLAVGYGTDSKDYWIIKNSWGASWGEKGYFRLVRNKNNQCGIASDSVYPKIS